MAEIKEISTTMLDAFATVISQIDEPVTIDTLESLAKIAFYLEDLAMTEMCLALLYTEEGNTERAEFFEALADERISLLTSVRSYLQLEYRDERVLH
jgi:hypothetical protein